MPYFPQIGSNMKLTQLPYSYGLSYKTVAQDMDSGMRFSFPRRAVGLLNHSENPLGNFVINFSRIPEVDADTLEDFFNSVRGRWGSFEFLDPGGNMLLYSEDYSQASWDKSNGPVTVGSSVVDPFGGDLATDMVAGAGNSFMMAVAGSASGGMSGMRLTVSLWVQARDSATQLHIGFVDSGFTQISGTTWDLTFNRWMRISHSATMWNDNFFRVIVGGFGTWDSSRHIYMFGAQCSPLKGEGPYVKTPGNYGYHPNCRFDIHEFRRVHSEPGHVSVALPVSEFYVNVP